MFKGFLNLKFAYFKWLMVAANLT